MNGVDKYRITIRLTRELCKELNKFPKGEKSKIIKQALNRYLIERPIIEKVEEKDRIIKELEEKIATLQSKEFDKEFLRWLDVEGFGFQWKHLDCFQKILIKEILDRGVPLEEAMFMAHWSECVDEEKKRYVWSKVRTPDSSNIEVLCIADSLIHEFRSGNHYSGDDVLYKIIKDIFRH